MAGTMTSARAHGRFTIDVLAARLTQRRRRHGLEASSRHRVMANSLPKSGTNLLLKLFESLPDLPRIRGTISRDGPVRLVARSGEPSLPIGVDWTATASERRMRRMLAQVPPASFCSAHIRHSEKLAEILSELDYRMVLIIRDPRDVVVSSGSYLARKVSHAMYPRFARMSEDDRIMASLRGVDPDASGAGLLDIRKRLTNVLRWRTLPFVHLARFEDLVGPQGGGNAHTQRQVIEAIVDHVGMTCSPEAITGAADGLFGGTHTFERGQIGSWRQAFTSQHVEAAKPLLDDLLIDLGYEQGADWSPELERA